MASIKSELKREKYLCYSRAAGLYVAPCTLFTFETTAEKTKAETFSGMDNTPFKLAALQKMSGLSDLQFIPKQ